MCTGTPGQSSLKRVKYVTRSMSPSPMAVHCTLAPFGVRHTAESRRLVVIVSGPSTSRLASGSSSVQSALPESRLTPT